MRPTGWSRNLRLMTAVLVILTGLAFQYFVHEPYAASVLAALPPASCGEQGSSAADQPANIQSPLPSPLLIKGSLLDMYKIRITITNTNQTYVLPVTSRKQAYDQAGYYQNGRLLKPSGMEATGFLELTALDIDHDGGCELKGLQRIDGMTSTDTVAYAVSIWKWRYNQWTLMRVELIPGRD